MPVASGSALHGMIAAGRSDRPGSGRDGRGVAGGPVEPRVDGGLNGPGCVGDTLPGGRRGVVAGRDARGEGDRFTEIADPAEAGRSRNHDERLSRANRDPPDSIEGIFGREQREVLRRLPVERDRARRGSVVDGYRPIAEADHESADTDVLANVFRELAQVNVDRRRVGADDRPEAGGSLGRTVACRDSPARPSRPASPVESGRRGSGRRAERDVRDRTRDDAEPPIGRARIRPSDDSDHGRHAALLEGRRGDPASWQADDRNANAASFELGTPAVAERRTAVTVPLIRTRRHSCAGPAAEPRTSGAAGRPADHCHPRCRDPGRAVCARCRSLDFQPVARGSRGSIDREQDLDGAALVLHDDSPAAGVKQTGAGSRSPRSERPGRE